MKSIFTILFALYSFCGFGQPGRSHPLPGVKTITFISVPSSLERIFGTISFARTKKMVWNQYDRRLADINGMEVYLVTKTCGFADKECLWIETPAQGEFRFLVLVSRKSKTAFVFTASYNFLSDSEVYNMSYRIKGHEIFLSESGFTEGEKGAEEYFKKRHYLVVGQDQQVRLVAGK